MRRRFRAPRRSLLAALIAAQFLPGAFPDASAQTTPTDSPATPPAAAPAGEPDKPRWQIAPIRWSGQIGLSASWSDSEGQPRRSQFNETFNISAASYIWQPWFIQVMGGAGLLLSQTRLSARSDADAGNGGDHGSSGSIGMTGNFALHVFPVSRFPFQFTVDASDSRATGDIVGSDYRSVRVGAQQNYSAPRGDTTYMARLESSTLTSDSFGRDRVNVLDGQMTTAWENQRVQVNANYSANSRSSDDLGSRTARLSAQHNWRPEESTTIDSLGSISHESRRFAVGTSEFTSDVKQVNSTLNWRSDWDEPLIVFGTARLYDSSITNGDATTTGRLANVNGSASYRFTPNLSVFGGLALSYIESGDQSDTLTSQAAGVQYQFDPRSWGPATYTANLGAAGSNQTGGELGGRRLLQLQAGHRISVPIPSGSTSAWNLSAGQDGTLVKDSDLGDSNTLVHSGSISWRYAPPAGLAGFASVSLADSRTHGGESAGEMQLANFQVSAQLRPSSYSSFNANLTAQVARQSTLRDPQPRVTRSASGGATYQHVRAFGVPRLRYIAQFNIYNQQTDRRLQGDLNAPRENVSWLFEQRLEYLIGRLDSRLTLRVAEVDGKKNASLIASVYRRFGR